MNTFEGNNFTDFGDASPGSSVILTGIMDQIDKSGMELPGKLADAIISGALHTQEMDRLELGVGGPVAYDDLNRSIDVDLVSTDPNDRIRAVHALGEMESSDAISYVHVLARLLRDVSWEVHGAALRALLKLGHGCISRALELASFEEISENTGEVERFLIFLSGRSHNRSCTVYAETREANDALESFSVYALTSDIPGVLACIALCLARMNFNIDKSLSFRIDGEVGMKKSIENWLGRSITSCRISRRGGDTLADSLERDLQIQLERGQQSLEQNPSSFLLALRTAITDSSSRGSPSSTVSGRDERTDQGDEGKGESIVRQGAQAFNQALPKLLKNKLNHLQLIAFHGKDEVTTAATLKKLLRLCELQKKPLEELFIGCISPQPESSTANDDDRAN